MKRTIIYLLLSAGLASCVHNPETDPADAPRQITFSGRETRAPGAPDEDNWVFMSGSPDYGTLYIHHTRETAYVSPDGQVKDADETTLRHAVNFGLLNPTGEDEEKYWYWGDKETTQHIFHAWNQPATQAGAPLVTVEKGARYGTVNLRMDLEPEIITEPAGDGTSRYRLSNLEFFIGAAKGPVTYNKNKEERKGESDVLLDFKHLVAKITVKGITYVTGEGEAIPVTEAVPFEMPFMPNKAYWTTGVPANGTDVSMTLQKPGLIDIHSLGQGEYADKKLTASDYGVTGQVQPETSFYIYPCMFADTNPLWSDGKLGEILFTHNGKEYYGSLEGILSVNGLEAGQHITVYLSLSDGPVGGTRPVIVQWSGAENEVTSHDQPGIYNEADWQKYIDWVNACQAVDSDFSKPDTWPEPPAGLFDEDGNLNLYCDLDLLDDNVSTQRPRGLIFPPGKESAGLNGNGHRIKVVEGNKDWSSVPGYEKLKDVYIGDTLVGGSGE